MGFIENLAALPETEGGWLRLFDQEGREIGVIENVPGTAGSFRIYAYLAAKYGEINAEAAREGLVLYAEHAEDARQNPRKHPNIDRLLEIESSAQVLSARIE
jgi:hypothetical protein